LRPRCWRSAKPILLSALSCAAIHSWAKAWNEELLPVSLYAEGKALPDEARFQLMPDGHATDVELILPRGKLACQVTVADPSWAEEGPGSSGGYLHHLQMECLREGRPAFGGANTAKTEGKIVSTPHARHVTEDLVACRRSLANAIRRKAVHDGTGCTLLIYARGQRFLLIDFDMATLVADAVRNAAASRFAGIAIVDNRFFWESA
jgi:hypothetical protein